MRLVSAVLLLHFLVITVAPAWITFDFLVERDRIQRELCVQRMISGPERTCHGECQLMKRLEKSGGREQNLPIELRAVRIGDMIAEEGRAALIVPAGEEEQLWGSVSEGPLEGHLRPHAPVPWC